MIANFEQKKTDLRASMAAALKTEDTEAFSQAFADMMQVCADETRAAYENELNELRQSFDTSVLSARGVRQLTSAEKSFYQAFGESVKSERPMQAVSGGPLVLPQTILEAVFDELSEEHELLRAVNFHATAANVKMIIDASGNEAAVWGDLCDEIVKELEAGFDKVETGLLKLSAFIPVCKQLLELGPEWIDRYVRTILTEAYANGLEAGIVDGTGKKQPIGMNRQVGKTAVVADGVYPKKQAQAVTDLSIETVGDLIADLAVNENGRNRKVKDLILVCSPSDYFSKVLPATSILAPDGTYRTTLPFNIKVIQSAACDDGEAIFGLGYRYFAAVGSNGRVDYSDHVHFLEDERVYIVKGFANGMPLDNNAFKLLDISGLKPAVYRVKQVTA